MRGNADARPPGSDALADNSVSAADFVRITNKLTIAAFEELVSNGGMS